jgi:HEAT repeat protein
MVAVDASSTTIIGITIAIGITTVVKTATERCMTGNSQAVCGAGFSARFPRKCTLAVALFFLSAGARAADPSPAPASNAWSILNASLHDDAEHRRQALAAVATISGNNSEAVKAALAALHDKDSLVRQSAALALGQMKATDAVPALKAALDDTGPVSFAAAKALTEIGDPSGREILIAVLEGDRKGTAPGPVSKAIDKGRTKLHHPGELVLMGAQDATGAMFGPASFAIPAVKDALELRSKGAPGRAAAAAYLARDPDPYAITLLEWALADDNQFVRLEAAKALGQRGNSGSIPKLQALLDDPHNIVRDFASASIVRIMDRNGDAGSPLDGPVGPVSSKKTIQ